MTLTTFENLRFFFAAFNLGAICFVQWVHYPLFQQVSASAFPEYHRRHVIQTTWLLGTTLFLEMLLNFWIFSADPKSLDNGICLGLLAAGWFITFFYSVPQHRKLEQGFELQAHRKLLISNWLRVASWGALCVFLFGKSF